MIKSSYFKTYRELPKEMYILFWARVINCMGTFILPLWALILTQKLGLSKTETGNLSSLLTLTQGPCLLLGGKLIDLFGRKKLLITCQILGSFFYILCGIVKPNFSMVLFLVIASDLYVAASPSYDAMVADITTAENRKASFSLIYLGVNIGMTISPLLGGLLFKNHLSFLFILDAATTLASCALITVFVKETKNGPSKSVAVEVHQDAKSAQEKSVFQILKGTPILMCFMGLMFVYNFCYTQWNFMLPLQFGDLYGTEGARFFSLISALNAFIVIIFTPLLTHLTLHFRPLMVIAGGGLFYFAAYFAFSFVKSMPLFLAAGAIFTFGEIIVTINLSTFIANHSPAAHRGRINSINMFITGAGNALGPLIIGHIITKTSYSVTWLSVAAFMFVGVSGIFFLDKKEKAPVMQANISDSTL